VKRALFLTHADADVKIFFGSGARVLNNFGSGSESSRSNGSNADPDARPSPERGKILKDLKKLFSLESKSKLHT